MQDVKTWINANTKAGPDDLLQCNSAREIAAAFCRSNNIPPDEKWVRDLVETFRQMGYVPMPGLEAQSTLVLVGQAKFDGRRW